MGPCWRSTWRVTPPIEGSPFTALSTAFMRDGGFLHVPANTDLTRPVHLVFVTTAEAAGSVTHPRNLDRRRAGCPSIGHRELREPGRGRRATGPTR